METFRSLLEEFFNSSKTFSDVIDGWIATVVRDYGVFDDGIKNVPNTTPIFEQSPVGVGVSIGIIGLSAIAGVIGIAIYYKQQADMAQQNSSYYCLRQLLELEKWVSAMRAELGLGQEPSYFLASKEADAELSDMLDLFDPTLPWIVRFGRRIAYSFKRFWGKSRSSKASYAELKRREAELLAQAFKSLGKRARELLEPKLKILPEDKKSLIENNDSGGDSDGADGKDKFKEILNQVFPEPASSAANLADDSSNALLDTDEKLKLNKFEQVVDDYFSPSTTKKEGFFKNLGITINTLWQSISTYSLFFWIGWFSYWLIAGVSQASGLVAGLLAFGLPALPVLGLLVAKLIIPAVRYIYAKIKKIKPVAVSRQVLPNGLTAEDAERLSKKALFVASYLQNLNDLAKKQQNKIKEKLPLKYDFMPKVISPDKAQDERDTKIQKIQNRLGLNNNTTRLRKIFIASVVGLMIGYISFFFLTWPISSIMVAFNSASAGIPDVLVFIGSLIIGSFFAVRAGTRASIEAKQNQLLAKKNSEALLRLSALRKHNREIRDKIKEKYQKVCDLLKGKNPDADVKEYKPIIPTSFNDRCLRRLSLKPSKWTSFKKWLNRLRVIIFSAGTGILLMRALIFPGAIFAVSQWYIFIPIGVVVGAVWAFLKFQEYQKNSKEQKAKRFIENAPLLLAAETEANNILQQQLAQQEAICQKLSPASVDAQSSVVNKPDDDSIPSRTQAAAPPVAQHKDVRQGLESGFREDFNSTAGAESGSPPTMDCYSISGSNSASSSHSSSDYTPSVIAAIMRNNENRDDLQIDNNLNSATGLQDSFNRSSIGN